MGRPTSIAGNVVKECLKQFPDTPILTLAKKLCKENPSLFTSIEGARAILRSHAGLSGDMQRGKIKDKSNFREKKYQYNPVVPESFEQDWSPFVLPFHVNKLLVLSDIHLPYHNVQSIELAVEYGLKNGANGILLNGDTLDCHTLSKYEKDPRKRTFSQEIESGRELLAFLRHTFDGVPIYFKMGNHEERYERFLSFKAPELLDCTDFKLETLLRFGEHGVNLITDKRIIKAGKLSIMHGHEFFGGGAGVNPARGYFMRSKESVLCGHNHQTSEHTEPTLSGDIITAWSTGCLSELHPLYMPVNKWNLGFAFVEIEKDGSFKVHNKRIFNGKIL